MENNHSEPFVFLFGRNLLHRQLTDKKPKCTENKGLPENQPREEGRPKMQLANVPKGGFPNSSLNSEALSD